MLHASPYLDKPLQAEADVSVARQAVADRAELYERMLGYDEMRAAYLARCSWEERLGHLRRYSDTALLAWAPLPHTSEAVAANTLHPDVAAEFWVQFADECTDWLPIVDDIVDSAASDGDRWRAGDEKALLERRIKRARDFVKVLRAEHARRAMACA